MTRTAQFPFRHMAASILLAACTAVSAAPVVLSTSQEAAIANGSYADNTNTSFGRGFYLVLNLPGSPRSIGLVQFDVSAYTGETVEAATLSLYKDSNPDADGIYNMYRITSAWAPSENFTFNSSAPTYDLTPVASLTFGDELNVYRDWNVSSVLQGWLSGDYENHGLWIERESGGENMAYLRSSLFGSETEPRLSFTLATDVVPEDPRDLPEPSPLALWAAGGLAAWFARRGVRARSTSGQA